jgi:hypothetical protein
MRIATRGIYPVAELGEAVGQRQEAVPIADVEHRQDGLGVAVELLPHLDEFQVPREVKEIHLGLHPLAHDAAMVRQRPGHNGAFYLVTPKSTPIVGMYFVVNRFSQNLLMRQL